MCARPAPWLMGMNCESKKYIQTVAHVTRRASPNSQAPGQEHSTQCNDITQEPFNVYEENKIKYQIYKLLSKYFSVTLKQCWSFFPRIKIFLNLLKVRYIWRSNATVRVFVYCAFVMNSTCCTMHVHSLLHELMNWIWIQLWIIYFNLWMFHK